MRKTNLETTDTVRGKIIEATGRRKACPYNQKENLNIITDLNKNTKSCSNPVICQYKNEKK